MMSVPRSHGGDPSDDRQLTLWPEDSHVNPSQTPARNSAQPISGGYGRPWPRSFAIYDHTTHSWKTSQVYLDGEWVTSSEIWPRSGMTRNGIAYRRTPSAPRTDETGYSLLPTPKATDGERGGRGDLLAVIRTGLASRRKQWPTPTANRWSCLQSHGRNLILGALNPTWVEWLMGYPLGWTDCAR